MITREQLFGFWMDKRRLQGWCSIEKAEAMMQEVHRLKPKVCVEVGVFGGRSLFPVALALEELGEGVVYGVDPWSPEASLAGTQDPANTAYWNGKHWSYETVYSDCIRALIDMRLTATCNILRITSDQASKLFVDESVDMLHIDGNHSTEESLADLERWVPKVKPGGSIWFDDIAWESLKPAVSTLYRICEFQRTVDGSALFSKP